MDLSLLWSSRKLQVTRDFVEDSRAEKISLISGVFHFHRLSNYSVPGDAAFILSKNVTPYRITQGQIISQNGEKINCFSQWDV